MGIVDRLFCNVLERPLNNLNINVIHFFSYRRFFLVVFSSGVRLRSYSHVGEPFPCFYSRAYPEMVITRYSWEDNLKHLILSLIIPNVIFAISIGVLSYWYCPCCDKACRKSTRVYTEKYPSKEE